MHVDLPVTVARLDLRELVPVRDACRYYLKSEGSARLWTVSKTCVRGLGSPGLRRARACRLPFGARFCAITLLLTTEGGGAGTIASQQNRFPSAIRNTAILN
jgi:hypothetical protein